jgi:nicotinamidase-related amidase
MLAILRKVALVPLVRLKSLVIWLKLGRNQVIVCGIETHVCVNQTVHDLLRLGYQVHLVTDALSSRSSENKQVGLAKMYAAGALPTSVECCLFEMLVESGTERFKAVQKLVK